MQSKWDFSPFKPQVAINRISGYYARCVFCRILSLDFKKCDNCRRQLPSQIKIVPIETNTAVRSSNISQQQSTHTPYHGPAHKRKRVSLEDEESQSGSSQDEGYDSQSQVTPQSTPQSRSYCSSSNAVTTPLQHVQKGIHETEPNSTSKNRVYSQTTVNPVDRRQVAPVRVPEDEPCCSKSLDPQFPTRSFQNVNSDFQTRNAESLNGSPARNVENRNVEFRDEESYAGVILKITLKDFMCHEYLNVEFNKRINFIIGKNGAGKSAIITAIAVCLGAGATSTDRAESLKKFIRDKCESAQIILTLNNRGTRAYKREIYGDSITIIRNIWSNRTQYRFLNSEGVVVSQTRDTLNAILSRFLIQPNNPVMILNQTKSRTFIQSTDEKKLYELFEAALKVDEMKFLFSEISTNKNYIESHLMGLEEDKTYLTAEIKKLYQECQKLDRARNLQEERLHLQNELLWAKVHCQNEEIVSQYNICENMNQQVNELKKQLDSTTLMEAETKQEVEELSKMLEDQTQRAAELKKQCQQAHEFLRDQKSFYIAKLQELEFLTQTHRRKRREIDIVTEGICSLKVQDSSQSAEIQMKKVMLQAKLVTIDSKIAKVNEEVARVNNRKFDLQNCLLQLKGEINHLEIDHQGLVSQLNSLKTSDRSLNIYAPYMDRLCSLIKMDQIWKFKKKPIGPFGKYIKVLDKTWAPGIEYFLGRSIISAFLVDNLEDEKVLKQVMVKTCSAGTRPVIYVSKFLKKVYEKAYQSRAQLAGYPTVWDILEVRDPNVLNSLIDNKRIESVLCIDDTDLTTALFQEESTVPRNCSMAINKLGDSYYPAPNYRKYDGLDPRITHRRQLLQVSVAEVRAQVDHQLKIVEESLASQKNQQQMHENEYKAINSELQQLATLHHVEQKKCIAIQEEIRSLEEEEASSEEYRLPILRDEANELQKQMEELQAKMDAVKIEMDQIKDEVTAAKANCDSLSSQANTDESEIICKIDVKKLRVRELLADKKRISKSMEETAQELSKKQKEIVKLEEQEKLLIEQARIVCPEEIGTRSYIEVEKDLLEAEKYLVSYQGQLGPTYEERKRDLLKKQSQRRNLVPNIEKLQRLVQAYINLILSRNRMFKKFVGFITSSVRVHFQAALTLRKFVEGKLIIDHSDRTISMRIAAGDKEFNAEMKDLSQLSGGERSLATVSFIMALWHSTDMPFYAMDEFSVFLDGVNADSSTKLLLAVANKKPESQFIFLTPKDFSKELRNLLFNSTDISVLQMAPPERNTADGDED